MRGLSSISIYKRSSKTAIFSVGVVLRNYQFSTLNVLIRVAIWGLRWWLSGCANAGKTGSIPGLGRTHMPQINLACVPQLLSLCSRAQEPQLL